MKRKLLSSLLAAVLLFSLAAPALAEGEEPEPVLPPAQMQEEDAAQDPALPSDGQEGAVDEPQDPAFPGDGQEGAVDEPQDPAFPEDGQVPPEAVAQAPEMLAAVPEAAGSITATLRFDYPQTVKTVQERKLTLELLSGEGSLGTVELGPESVQSTMLGDYPAVLTLKNTDGVAVTTETQAGYLELAVTGLPLGTYDLTFQGKGYSSCTITDISLAEFSQHVVLGTEDVFQLGDVTGDGSVDEADVAALAAALKSPWSLEGEAAVCDLNGDGALDVSDLAYVTRLAAVKPGQAEVCGTILIDPAKAVTVAPEEVNVTEGSIASLFQGGSAVTFAPKEDGGAIGIPLDFGGEGLSLQQVQLVTPAANGAVEAGTAEVVYLDEDGQTQTMEIPFGGAVPADVHFLTRDGSGNTLTIDLGKRVPVKKVTLTVTKVTGQDGSVTFAVVEQIKFLQDIVPENPVAPNSKVKSVVAIPGNGEITLKWPELPNVTGYYVENTEAEDGKPVPPMTVHTTTAKVMDLKNLVEYTFTVTPINDNGGETWQGQPSDPITAVPLPASAPNPPDFLTLTEENSSLTLSWGKTDNANYYQVFYRAAGESAFIQWGGNLTEIKTLLTGLTNGVEYELYVKAGNDAGLSGESRHVMGTPKSASFVEPEGIPKDGRIPATMLSDIRLTNPNNVATSQYPNTPFDIKWVADGDYATHWTSQSYGDGGQWWISKEIQFTFSEPQDLSNVVYVPRQENAYRGNLKSYYITVWDTEGNQTVLASDLPVRNSPGTTGFAVLPFAPTKGIKRIDVTVVQEAYSSVSLSEIIFLTYDPTKDLDLQISALFADETKTTLESGVDQARIDSLAQALTGAESYYLYPDAMRDELALASELLAGKTTGRVIKGIESRGGGAVNQGQGGSLLQPLGTAALAGQQITIYASGIPAGKRVQLVATQFFAEANAWQAPVAELTNGRNVVTIPKIGSQNTQRGGSLYLTYSGEGADGITLHVRRATTIPMLNLSDSSLSEDVQRARIAGYLTELNAYQSSGMVLNATEISFPSVLLSIPADKAKAALNSLGAGDPAETLYQDLLTWNEFMATAYRTQGIDDSSLVEVRQNVRNMQMFGKAFMYAAGSHVGVGDGSCGGLLMGKPTAATGTDPNRLFGWGIAHEVGHNMDKLGKLEITNNIYSLVMQTRDSGKNTQTSRLEGGAYEQVFAKTAAGYPGASSNGSVALAMYWQLHLAYDDGNQSFWSAFFKAWKSLPADSGAYEDRVALAAAQASNHDTTEFFTRWGMRLSDATKATLAKYETDSRATWYLNDASRRDRLAGGEPVTGNIAATAVLLPAAADEVQNQVSISIDTTGLTDLARIQGYEILRDGNSVAFSTEPTYTEAIGSANNIAYSYTVQAYDILGNKVGAVANAGQVRIAYDKTIDAVVQRTGSVFTAKLETPLAVSGVKITLPAGSTGVLPVEGAFSVEVTLDGTKTVAKSGDYAHNDAAQGASSYIAYFTKPGADTADTRIWTFDAETITFTDTAGTLPQDAVVQFISYAGDDVGFYASGDGLGPVGTLKADFVYSDNGVDTTIPAGTVVVVGAYRGDPLFNTIRVNGEYVTSTVAVDGSQTDATTKVPLPGYSLLFAELPADGAVSDISDGFYLFVPDMEQLAGLLDGLSPAVSGDAHDCTLGDLMPARIQAEIRRTDSVDGGAGRLTGSTLWLPIASFDTLPEIELKGDSAQ